MFLFHLIRSSYLRSRFINRTSFWTCQFISNVLVVTGKNAPFSLWSKVLPLINNELNNGLGHFTTIRPAIVLVQLRLAQGQFRSFCTRHEHSTYVSYTHMRCVWDWWYFASTDWPLDYILDIQTAGSPVSIELGKHQMGVSLSFELIISKRSLSYVMGPGSNLRARWSVCITDMF